MKLAFIVSKNNFEELMMSIILSMTGSAMDIEADLFFTFYGLKLLKKGGADKAKIKFPPLLRNIGTKVFKKKLKKVGYDDPSEMLKTLVETGKVRLWACTTTMQLMDIKKEDLIDEVEGIVGAATFLDIAADAQHVLVM